MMLRLAPSELDRRRVGSLRLNVRMQSSGSNLEENGVIKVRFPFSGKSLRSEFGLNFS